MRGEQKPSAGTFRVVCGGEAAEIRLSPAAFREYEQAIEGKDVISLKRKTHLQRYFEEFCRSMRPRLSDEKFKKEGNFPDGKGSQVGIWVFKAWQWRLYGSIVSVEGKRCFVGTRVDAAKKQDKANQGILRNTASDIAALLEYGKK